MSARYRLTRSAKRNLQEISDYLTAEAGEDVALRIVTGILDAIATLSEQPRAGVEAGTFGLGVRKFPVGRYIIYYRAFRSRIEILHAFHGARDQSKAWRGKS